MIERNQSGKKKKNKQARGILLKESKWALRFNNIQNYQINPCIKLTYILGNNSIILYYFTNRICFNDN
jgi:hypothetical protein